MTHHFEIGKSQFLVMDFIEGEDLAQRLRRDGRLPLEDVLPWARQIGAALTYLHGLDPPVFHRDLKPSNIKIAPSGEAILVDFGIAKEAGPDQKTSTGAKGVTPGYAPPEQYGLGRTDARTDVYAFGATLYTLLTGKPPPDSVQRLLGTVELAPPATITMDLPPHVARAIELSMAPGKEDRLPDIATLLRLIDDPNATWPPSEVSEDDLRRAEEMEQRKKRQARLWAGVGLSLVVGSFLTFLFAGRVEIALWMARTSSDSTPAPALVAGVPIAPLGTPRPTSSPGPAPLPTATSIPTPTLVPVSAGIDNGSAWRRYGAWRLGESPFSLAPDGETAAVVLGQGVALVDPVTGAEEDRTPAFLVGQTAYGVGHSGDTLLVGVEGEILHWDLATDNLEARLPMPGHELRLSPSGNLLAVRDKYITVLHLTTGRRLTSLGEPDSAQDFALSPDDRTFALSEGGGVALWDLTEGRLRRRLVGHGEPTQGLAFTADGSRLVSASGDVWDPATGELLVVFDSATDEIAISPNGDLIIGRDGSVWSAATGDLVGEIRVSGALPADLFFTPDGRFLLRRVGAEMEIWVVDPGAPAAVAVAPSAPEEIAGERIDDLNLYRLARGDPLGEPRSGFDLRRDGRAAAAWRGSQIAVFDLEDGERLAGFSIDGTIRDATFLGDGHLLVLVDGKRTERWEIRTSRKMQTYASGGEAIEASPTGEVFAVRGKYIQVIEALSGDVIHSLGSADAGQDFAFAPDGRSLLIAAGPGVGVWDVDRGVLVRQLAGHGPPAGGLSITPDGRRAASASGDVWDLETGRSLAAFDTAAEAVALSADGRLVVDTDGGAWNAETGFRIGDLALEARRVSFALDDRGLLVLDLDGRLAVLRPAAAVRPPAVALVEVPSSALPLTSENAIGLELRGWWGRDDLLAIRSVRDGADPRAASFGDRAFRVIVPSPDGITLTAAHAEGIDLLDPFGGTVAASYRIILNPDEIEDLAYTGTHLLVIKGAAGVERWDLAGGRLLQRYEVAGETVGASPDGRWIAVRDGGRLWVVDLVGGEVVLGDIAVSPAGRRFAFSPDGRLLAAAHDALVDVWDVETGTRVGILRSQGSVAGDLAFSPDGSRLVSASGSVWDVASGERVVEFGSSSEVGALAAGGKLLIDGAGGVWDVGDGHRRATLFDLRALGEQIVVAGEGRVMALRSEDGRVFLWSVRRVPAPPASEPRPHEITAENAAGLQRVGHLGRGRLRGAVWSLDDSYLAVNTTLNAVVYEADSLEPLTAYEAGKVVAFAADSTVLVGGDRALTRCDPTTGAVLETFGMEGVVAAAYSPDGVWLALAGRVSAESQGDGVALMALSDGLVRVLDPGRNPAAEVDSLEFTSDSRRLVVSQPLAISLWDVATGTQVREPIGGTRRQAEVSPDGATLAYQTPTGIVVESLESGGRLHRYPAQSGDQSPDTPYPPTMHVTDIDFIDNAWLLVFYRWVDPESGAVNFAFVPNYIQEAFFGAARAEYVVKLSRPRATTTAEYEDERPPVIPALSLSPTGKKIACLGSDGIVRVFTSAGRLVAETAPEPLDQMALSPDGLTLAVPDALGGLQILDFPSGDLRRRIPGLWYPHRLWFSSRSVLTVVQTDGRLIQIDVEDGRIIEEWHVEPWVEGDLLVPSADGIRIALFRRTAGRNQVLVFGLRPEGVLLDLGRFPTASAPAFSPDGSTLGVRRRDTIELWDLDRGEVNRFLNGESEAGAFIFTPDGRHLIDGAGKIWALDGSGPRSIDLPLGLFAVSPNGEVLVTGEGMVWDLRRGRSLGRLDGVLAPAVQMVFTPDGDSLLWLRAGGVVEIWGVPG